MRSIFFYAVGISFMGGIFLRSFLMLDWYAIIFAFLLGCALLCAGVLVLKEKTSPLVLIGVVFVSGALGMMRLHSEEVQTSVLTQYENQEIELIGRVVREPEVRENTMHFYVRPEGEESNERVLVTTEKFDALDKSIGYGDVLSVSGTLKLPEAFESDGGRVFNYPGYLKTRGVTYMIRYADVSLHSGAETSFLSSIYSGKSKFMNALERILPMPHAGLGEGILLGVKRALGTDLEETFRETGIIHIVVLSGYNVMIVVDAMMFFLAYLFLPRMRMIIGLVAITLFVLLVGPSATVVRASLMASLLLVARATGRIYAILRALVLAGILMLLVNPYLLVHDPGFQLSFVATFALILFAPHVEKRLQRVPETVGMRTILTATIATQIFVLPLLLYHTGLLSFVSVAVNALVLPMVPVAMFLTFLTGVSGLIFEPIGIGIGFITYYSLGYIIFISELFGSFSFAATSIVKFPFWIVVVAYGLLGWLIAHLSVKEERLLGATETTLSDWTIEEEVEEKEKPSDAQSASLGSSLPFR